MDWFSNLMQFEAGSSRLESHIKGYLRIVSDICNDQYALQEAKNLVPIAQLVQDHLDILEGDYNDNLLPWLTDWFATEFFTWFEAPNCEKCDQATEQFSVYTNQEGLRVEVYYCQQCDFTFEFLRHNDPSILLVTRTGRCGEWANCFFLFLTALDYKARIILDTTDHVWNEVWSESQQRWIHVDPCENVVDKPLLYELGWKKKLQYCLGFGQHEVLDVTPRYVQNFGVTLMRRNLCSEDRLRAFIEQSTLVLTSQLPQDQKDAIQKRRDIDLACLKELALRPRDVSQGQYGGRKTGDLAWRLQRSECDAGRLENKFVIKVRNNNGAFKLRYNSLKNRYESSQPQYDNKTWLSITNKCCNLNYKYERDWKTAYIARLPDCPHDQVGKISWKFDLSELETLPKSIQIEIRGKIYDNTSIKVTLLLYDKLEKELDKISLEINQVNNISPPPNAGVLELEAHLSGGQADDEVAWQKPQLFRQTKGSESEKEWPFAFTCSF